MSEAPFKRPSSYLLQAATLAMCSLLYELNFAKIVAEITGNPTIWESVSMAVFLCGMGARSLTFRGAAPSVLLKRLLTTEVTLIGGAVMSYFFVFLAEAGYRMYVFDAGILRESWGFPPVFLLGGLAQLPLFWLGWLTAFELQFFLNFPDSPNFRFKESAVLAAYHFGALAGTGAFIFAHRHGMEPFTLLAWTIAVNFAFALYLMTSFAEGKSLRRALALAGVLASTAVVVAKPFRQIILQNHYYNMFHWTFDHGGLKDVEHPLGPKALLGALPGLPTVTRIRSPYQVLDLVPDNEKVEVAPGAPEPLSLYINGRFQIGSASAVRYHESLAHVALGYLLQPAKHILVLGGGDGILVHELLKYPGLEGLDLVEIDPEVLRVARETPAFTALNFGSLDDPRCQVHMGDAMAFVRASKASYDAVFIDLTYPYDFDSGRFFGVEFFRMVKHSLKPGGLVGVGSPFDLVEPRSRELFALVRSTLAAAGFPRYAGYGDGNDHFLVAAKDQLRELPKLDPAIELKALKMSGVHLGKTTATKLEPGDEVLSVMRPRLLMTNDPFY